MALEKKQKIMIPLIAIAFIILAWQGYSLLSGDDVDDYSPPPTPPPHNVAHSPSPPPASHQQDADDNNAPVQHSAASPSTPQHSMQDSQARAMHSATPQHTQQNADQHASGSQQSDTSTLTPQQQVLLSQQQAREQQYISMVNQYQLAQMQKKLADINAQLAQAKLKEAQSLAKASEQNLPIVTAPTVSHISAAPASGGGSMSTQHTTISNYRVLYVSYVNKHWMATLSHAGQLHNVYIGSQFADGANVRVIDRNGVVLEQNGITRYLTIPIPMTVDEQKSLRTGATLDTGGGDDIATAATDAAANTASSASNVYQTLSEIQKSMPQK